MAHTSRFSSALRVPRPSAGLVESDVDGGVSPSAGFRFADSVGLDDNDDGGDGL